MNRHTLFLIGTLAMGCDAATYDGADIFVLHQDALEPRQLSAGGAATVKVEPVGDADYTGLESVDVRADNSEIASVRQTILSDSWTILGHQPGQASFRVYVEGDLVERFTFTVVPFEEGVR